MQETYKTGGYFDWDQLRLRMILDKVAEDDEVEARFPRSAFLLSQLSEIVFDAIDEMDQVLARDRVRDEAEMDYRLLDQVAGAVRATQEEFPDGIEPEVELEVEDE